MNPQMVALRWAGHSVERARGYEVDVLEEGDLDAEFWSQQAAYQWVLAARWILRAADLPGEP
jgi:hypothetical protein